MEMSAKESLAHWLVTIDPPYLFGFKEWQESRQQPQMLARHAKIY
jgi:hypothetical protein